MISDVCAPPHDFQSQVPSTDQNTRNLVFPRSFDGSMEWEVKLSSYLKTIREGVGVLWKLFVCTSSD